MTKRLISMLLMFLLVSFFTTNAIADEYTKLLIHSDTTNGSTTFEDSSDSGHSITPVGDAQHSTAQAKFGGSSIHFDGSGDYLSIPDSDDWNFGSGDFTIETWVNRANADICIYSQYDDDNNRVRWKFNGEQMYFLIVSQGAPLCSFNPDNTGLTTNTWHHLALIRFGNMLSLFVDGELKASQTISITYPNLSANFSIGVEGYGGNPAATYWLNGYIDEIRISKGIARWTSNFTPPTAPYGGTTGPTVTLTTSPPTIQSGDTATLSWTSTNADTVSIDNGIGEVTPTEGGTYDVSPTATTTYTITATGTGDPATASVTVTVEGGQCCDHIEGDFIVDGNVGIGTSSPQSKLAVNGTISAKEVNVTMTGWPDFVFDEKYKLPPLEKVESYINENRHLPDIPSEEEMRGQGLNVSEILSKQMQKIEELTLYLIRLKKDNEALRRRVTSLEKGK